MFHPYDQESRTGVGGEGVRRNNPYPSFITLCPTRIFGLYDLIGEFCTGVRDESTRWASERGTIEIARKFQK